MLSGVNGLFAMSVHKLAFITHDPVNPLVVDLVMPLQSQASPGKAVAIGGSIRDHDGNGLLDYIVIAARW